MATMNISLPDQMKQWVEEQVQTGRYGNASDYVRDLVRRDQERALKRAEFERLVQEGIDSGISPLTPEEVFAEARRRAGAKSLGRCIGMGYSFTEQATLDAYHLYETSLDKFGRRAAEKYFSIMLDVAQFTADHPLAAPERSGGSIAYRVRYFGAHLLVYRIVDEGVVILRLFHQSQDWIQTL